MKYTVDLTVIPGEEKDEALLKNLAERELRKKGIKASQKDFSHFVFRKKSLDARRGQIKLHLRYDVYTGNDKPELVEDGADFKPAWKHADGSRSVVIVGSGPAGLFAALKLLEHGIKPVILERGPETSQRKRDIADISRKGFVNADSNYCFGEGGAGTFSDGKLYTRSNKRGNISKILAVFNYHGAQDSILTDAHPHIGTDKLPGIIDSIKKTIISFGGEVHFNTRCCGFIIDDGKTVTGVSAENVLTGEKLVFKGDAVILASGHSAPDIYEQLASIDAASLEPKTFACGVRVEHPREVIDRIQYHGKARNGVLPAAEYRLTTQVDGRGVYSFCMCPGGLVVPSASAPDEIVVNGMSPSSRNAYWSNAAFVVETRPEDAAAAMNLSADNPLAGLMFRTHIEKSAKAAVQEACAAETSVGGETSVGEAVCGTAKIGASHEGAETSVCADASGAAKLNPQAAPAQRLVDFLAGRLSSTLPKSSYTPGLVSVRLDKILPAHIADRLKQAFLTFDRSMKGFIDKDALLIAPETRTSTPVRILRDAETLQSVCLKRLYPAGEGAGYAGGIVSSAMDGEKAAEKCAEMLFVQKETAGGFGGIKAFVFDMDGVILDSETLSDRTWIKTAEEMHLPDIENVLNECRGCNNADIAARLNRVYSAVPGFDGNAFLKCALEHFYEIEKTEGIPLMKGVVETLEELKTRGYRIALASSTAGGNVRRQLTNAGVIRYFEEIITGDMVEHSKPSPEIYQLACKKLGLKVSECAAVEDSPNGIKSAFAAGLKCVMIPDKIQPTEEIMPMIDSCLPSLLEIKSLLR